MPRLSRRVLELKEAATLKMAQMARDLAAQGKDVVSLTIGEPDFDTPQYIKDAATRALAEGYTKYTPVPGLPVLREAICEKLRRDNGLHYSPNEVVVSTGAKQSIMNTCLALLDPGDEALFLAPYWVSYYEMARFAGATPVVVSAGIDQDYKVTAAQIAAAITPRSRLLVLNTPCNPSGSVYSADELAAIADVVRAHDELYVISDEIYEHITFGVPHVSLASFEGMAERTVTVNGMSKGFAMTGWRLGYLAAPEWIARATAKIQGQFTSGANAFGQVAAAVALTGNLDATHAMRDAYRQRKDLVCDLLKAIPGVAVNDPQGAFYVFPDVTRYYGKSLDGVAVDGSVALCELLLSEAHVALVPGAAFGDDRSVRLSCAASEAQLREGVGRMAGLLARLA